MPSFGAKLKQQRELRGITLEEISQTTKIGSRFLHALEEDHFDQLPGGIFNKGFVRAYARCVGFDEDEAIAGYMEATGTGPEQPTAAAPLAEPRLQEESYGAARLPWETVALVLVVAALVLAIWGVHQREKHRRNQASAPQSAASTLPSASRAEKAAAPVPAKQPATTPPVTAGRANKSDVAPAGAINVRIKTREDSWISIAADGKQIMRGTMAAETEKTVSASREIVVKAGNVGAIDFELNGKKLPVQGNNAEVKTLIFDAAGVHAAAAAPPPVPAPDAVPSQP